MAISQEKKCLISKLAVKKLAAGVRFDARSFSALKRKMFSAPGGVASNAAIISQYQKMVRAGELPANAGLERILRKRPLRTLSGVAPVAVLVKPYPCPGHCAYCPSEKNIPQSYLSNEPAVMRALACGFAPALQVQSRLRALTANGHAPEKIELIVIGGTWSVLPEKYQFWFIKECFRGANAGLAEKKSAQQDISRSARSIKAQLAREQKKNARARHRLIGISVETRPDFINDKELWHLRELGVTRIELGVQAVDDRILRLNRRGHGVDAIAEATVRLRHFGFKITYHIMPGLPGATPARDFFLFQKLFRDQRFQPDQIKFYPTVVTRGSLLYRWWKQGEYRPYSPSVLRRLIINCKKIIPPYVRVLRLIRDIPSESIAAGNKITNLRQILQDQGAICQCIRCREARGRVLAAAPPVLDAISYPAADGQEIFFQYTDKKKKILYGFCRLRLSAAHQRPETDFFCNAALVRELHVYGELVPVGGQERIQHAGLGKKLLASAEKAAAAAGCRKIIVIAGVGVRPYYRKLGYRLARTYMVKGLSAKNK